MAVAVPSQRNNQNMITSSNELCPVSSKNSQICICLLCGLPGSGKSTLLRSLTSQKIRSSSIQHLSTNSATTDLETFAIAGIEYDSILPVNQSTLENYGQFQEQEFNGKWKCDRSQIVSTTEALVQHICSNSRTVFPPYLQPQENQTHVWQKFLQILDLLETEMKYNKNKVLLVVDDNMYFRSMRYEYYKLARKYQTGYCQIHVQCSIDKAMERNKGREEFHQVPEEIILRMSDKFEPPDPEKYKWETNSITISSEVDTNIDQVCMIVQKAFINPVQSLEEINEEEKLKSRTECSASMLHQADLILRKCVTTKMADLKAQVKPEKLKDISRHVCLVKEKIIHDLKDGQLPCVLSPGLNITNSAQDPNSEFFRFIEGIFLREISKS